MPKKRPDDSKSDVNKHLEALAGEQLTAEALGRIRLILVVASSTRDQGSSTSRNILIPTPNFCENAQLLDVAAVASTGSDGTVRLRLTNFLCPAGDFFDFPLNVVATPLTDIPRFLTLSRVLVNNGADVEITVRSWDPDGSPAPNVPFDWRCRVKLPPIVL